MKSLVQRILQLILGYPLYLWVFTRYKLKVLKNDKSEKDFFFFLNLIPKEAAVLDIGANLGLMSYYLAQHCTEVHAFEPMPNNIKILEKLQKHYDLAKLHIHPIALGDATGEIELILPEIKGVKKQGLSHVKSDKMTEFNEGQTVRSKVYRLDDYEAIQNLKIDAIKMDVENFEFEVFKGAKQLLSKNKPLIYCELWDNQNRYDCFNFLESLGYIKYVLEGDSLKALSNNETKTQNFFFIHPQA